MNRTVSTARLAPIIAAGLVSLACGEESGTPAGTGGSTGNPSSKGAAAGTLGTGGSTSVAGSSSGGASATGGASGSNAGSGGATGGTGTNDAGGTAGSSGGAGGTVAGRRGSTANVGGSITGLPRNHCHIEPDLYRAGGTCTADQGCSGDCGPYDGVNQTGIRGLKCVGGTFTEVPCTFEPWGDYACFKLPSPVPACPAGTIQGTKCDVPNCSPCGSATGEGYLTESGKSRTGFCVCAVSEWECGTINEYPCYPKAGAELPASCL